MTWIQIKVWICPFHTSECLLIVNETVLKLVSGVCPVSVALMSEALIFLNSFSKYSVPS